MKVIVLLALTICLVACKTTTAPIESPPKIEIVKVQVPVSCIKNLPVKPILITDAQLDQLAPGAWVTAMHIDRLLRDAYMALIEPVLEGCK